MIAQPNSRHAILVVIAMLGCAKGSETQLDPTGTLDSSVAPDATFGDTGGDTAPHDTAASGSDTKHDISPLFDSDLFCGDIGLVNTCDLVTDVGSVALGAKKTVWGNVPLTGGDVWYRVTFESLDDTKAHPRVQLEGADAGAEFRFEIVKSCAKETLACGDDASTGKLNDFEQKYADATPPDPGSDAFVPITFGVGGTAYVRVYRNGPPSDCVGFILTLTN